MIIRSINVLLQDEMANFDIQQFFIKFGLLILSFAALAIFSTLILSRISNQVIFDLRMSMSDKVMNSNFESLEFKRSDMMAVLNSDIKTIAGIMNRVPGILSRFVIGIGGIIYLLYISWKLSTIILFIFCIVAVITYFTNKKQNQLALLSRKSHTMVWRGFNAIVNGIKEMYSNPPHKKHFLNNYLPQAFKQEFEHSIKERINGEISSKSTEALMLIGIALLVLIISLYSIVTIGKFIEFLTVSLFIINPLSSVASFTRTMSPFRAALNEIEELGISMEHNRQVTDEPIPQEDLNKNILFKDLSFRYYNSDIDDYFQLGPLNFEIERGKITMIIGGNGSGKTTLAKILCGLYQPQKGMIMIGQTEITNLNLDSFRSLFSPIFTDNFLFTNLRYIAHWDQKKAEDLLKLFDLDQKVKYVNQEAPRDVSIGQQKRLSLVKALMENNDLFLFDEWAANQDPRFKKIFYHKIVPELKKQNKTIILISHDDAYFDVADNIIHLREGQMYSKAID